MKYILTLTFILLASPQTLVAKGSLATNQAFEEYRKNAPDHKRSEVLPGPALSELLEKRDTMASSEEVLAVLTIIRDAPSKEFIPQLKELWRLHQKLTFMVRYPNSWRTIKTEDYHAMLCDEIKVLIKGMGGDTQDLDAIEKALIIADTGDPLELIKKLDANDDSDTFTRCLFAIDRDWTLSGEDRTQLRVRFLIIVNRFLSENSNLAGSESRIPSYPFIYNAKPTTPPGKDPARLSKYEQLVAENSALPLPQQKYNGLIRCRQATLNPLVSEIKRNPAALDWISNTLEKECKNSREATGLMELIKHSAVERGITVSDRKVESK